VYAGSAAAAGEADRAVRQQVQALTKEHHREPGKGLVVVSDKGDDLFTGDLESLLRIVAGERARQDPDAVSEEGGLEKEVVGEAVSAVELVGPIMGLSPEQVATITALPLGRDDMADLLGLPPAEAESFDWAVSVPTRAAMRAAVKTGIRSATKSMDLLTRIALVPVMPFAEKRAVEELCEKRAQFIGDQMRWADSGLKQVMIDKRREDQAVGEAIGAAFEAGASNRQEDLSATEADDEARADR
jgi:hypothetical protein